MAGERLNSEKKIEHDKIKIKLGTIDKKNPKVVYIEGRTFVTPDSEKDNTPKDITDMKHNFKLAINEFLYKNQSFDSKYILDFQVAAGGIHLGKKSFMSFQIILTQKDGTLDSISELRDKTMDGILTMVDSLSKDADDRGYILSKVKRKIEE